MLSICAAKANGLRKRGSCRGELAAAVAGTLLEAGETAVGAAALLGAGAQSPGCRP